MKLDDKDVEMEMDRYRASVTVISEQNFRQTLKSTPEIQPSDVNLHTYRGVVGVIQVPVECNIQKETIYAIVVAGKTPNLLGRNWLEKI